MRTFVLAVIGLMVGFLAGFVLSGVVGIGAFLLFGGIEFFAPIRYLPLATALVGAAVAPLLDTRVRSGSS